MKKIIPFEKELMFKTKICEITSISLEHKCEMESSDLITGEFYITGDYKMTEGSINREKFDYTIPFDIALDSRYDTKNMVIDIDDFEYKVIDNDILKIKISLYIEGNLEKKEESFDKKEENKEIIEEIEITPSVVYSDLKEEKKEHEEKNIFNELERNEEQNEEIELNISNVNNNENINLNKNSMFDNFDNLETYTTYHVYIVKEDDTIDKILNKYNVTKEILDNYNEISDIKPGDKIIIPTVTNG